MFIVSSCTLSNPPQELPFYIRINSVDLSTDYSVQGSNAQKITDVWIYSDNNLTGAFELPALIPVVPAGNHTLTIRAGIEASGFTDLRIRYPFYEPFTVTLSQSSESTIELNPVITYYDSTLFLWLEDFESSGFTLGAAQQNTAPMLMITDPYIVFEGQKCIGIYLDPSLTFKAISEGGSSPFQIPQGDVFLELNYRCSNTFSTGIVVNQSGVTLDIPVLTLYPSPAWNKIYIDLTGPVKNYQNAGTFDVFFSAQPDAGLPVSEIYMDNIKLVTR
ncbi:MAG: hypothetical protein HYY40_11450 [Bacteroidetes bacterium]|nr:hypothetical protein [Bacteroidota bacterium]